MILISDQCVIKTFVKVFNKIFLVQKLVILLSYFRVTEHKELQYFILCIVNFLTRNGYSSSALYRISNLQNHISPLEANNKLRSLVKISPEVSEALSKGLAVVALESTIISHGMPYPQNLQTAKEVESIVRENGAVPATIAILNGVPCIGLNEEELERLASLGKSVQKTAGRDIAYVVATKGNGATTVSAILFFASMVGIQVFVTGGIGGVHRHANHSMDISSDLTALGRTPIAVISAGVKSILDIPKTLEYLVYKQN
ncbi:hypothetical protein Bca4012_037355 [Brassica carinata]